MKVGAKYTPNQNAVSDHKKAVDELKQLTKKSIAHEKCQRT